MTKHIFAIKSQGIEGSDEVMCEIYFNLNSYQIRKIEEFIAYSHGIDIDDIIYWLETDE